MQLIVKPMGYGDCCILRQGRALLIADCGSRTNRRGSARHGRSASAYAWAAIREELADAPVADLIITRFDPDRFNGFVHLKGPRAIQIPQTNYKGKPCSSFIFYQCAKEGETEVKHEHQS